MLYGIAAATAALVLAALLAALLCAPALRLGLLDRHPRNRPLPLLGGVAVVLPTAGVATLGDLTGVAPLGEGVAELLAAAAGIALLGLAADVRPLRTRALFAGTAVAAAWVMPYEETGLLGGALAAGWVAVIALAFRSLDHADGLAGTVGVVTAFGAGVCAAAEVMDGLAVLLSVLAAALTGFLMHNWPPARIGLGACGSLFTGFLLAASAVFTRAGRDPGESAAVLFALTAVAAIQPVLGAARWWRERPGRLGVPNGLPGGLPGRRLGGRPGDGSGRRGGGLPGGSPDRWSSGLAGRLPGRLPCGLHGQHGLHDRPGDPAHRRLRETPGNPAPRLAESAYGPADRRLREAPYDVARPPREAPYGAVRQPREAPDDLAHHPREAPDRPARQPREGAPDGLACRLRRLGMTAQGVVVVPSGGAVVGVVVAVLVHTGAVGAGAVWWVLGGVIGLLLLLCRSGRREASPQVGARLRVRSG